MYDDNLMDILAGLNPTQRLAVEHGRGPALVLAGAGSGKTRVITHRIAYLIQNAAARPEAILAVTFTNKAAGEMRDRVHALLGSKRSAEPLISTYHAFCVRLLRRDIHHLGGYRRDFSIYDTDDQAKLIKQILEEIKIPDLDLPRRELLSRISYAKNHGVLPERYRTRFPSEIAQDVQQIYERYNARLRQANSLDFDDLLLLAVRVLKQLQELRNYYSDRYRYILVDEYQDTNHPQYELLRLLTALHTNLFVVGDEDQSIYKFRGADIQNILRFEKDFPGARIIKLEQNYRSTQNILRVAGSVVENNTERKGKTLWTENLSGDVVTCCCTSNPREEADWVSAQIRTTLEAYADCRFGILYRANFISRNFEEVLTEQGVSYALVGSVAFFGRAEVKDLLAYLRVVINPEDDVALLRIINTPPRGIGVTTVDMLTRSALERSVSILRALRERAQDQQTTGRASRALVQFCELLDEWTNLRETVPTKELLQVILRDIKYQEMLLRHETAEEAENRLANLDELIRAAGESELRGETASEFLDRASLSSELDHLDPNAGVALMTLHSAKGLEFDTVFLVGMEEGLFPHAQSLNSKENLEEERRLCYVGITRARRKLFLTWTPFRRNYGTDAGIPSRPSRFLKEMPHDLLEDIDMRPDYSHDRRSFFRRRVDEDAEEYPSASQYRYGAAGITEKSTFQPKSIAELRAYIRQKEQSAEPPNPRSSAVFRRGMRVRHNQFGDGIVISRERMGRDIRLTIVFSRVGKKTLVEKYAKLEAI